LCFVSDIDECETNPCDQLCTNNLGSYSCSCYSGYQLVNDSRCIAEGQLLANRYCRLVFSCLSGTSGLCKNVFVQFATVLPSVVCAAALLQEELSMLFIS